MTKYEFNESLRVKLYGVPAEEINKSIEYYDEMIDERIDSGMSEEEAVNAAGPIDDIVKEILSGTGMPVIIKEKVVKKKLSALEIILLILGSPIWLSIMIALASVVLCVYISIWAVVISICAAALAFAVCTIGGIALFFFMLFGGNAATGILSLGAGLVLGGLTILSFFACKYLIKGAIWLGKKIWLGIKLCFVGRKEGK